MPPQTPALPGAWLNTPANKKSVRFQEEPSLDSECNTDTHSVKQDKVVTSVKLEPPRSFPGPTPTISSSDKTHNSSPSHSRSPRKTATIRVMDSFGREEKNDSSSRNGSIRIVDAMGRVVEDTTESSSATLDGIPTSRTEALGRVRNGLHALAEELKDEESRSRPTTSGHVQDRIRKLERTSSEARESRQRLNTEIFANGEDIKTKLAPLRASMQRSTSSFLPPPSARRSTSRSWLIWGLLQLFIVFIMAAKSFAKNTFLTTYYEPLYPDLFFYTTLPTNYCSSPSFMDVLRQEGFRASILQVLDYIAIIFSYGRLPCQYDLHNDRNAIWPPT
ncbi:hypothetical protein BDP27DRAFT_449038 [Rhodocollybia butyracea]|uniref:Uncharacterized protein n=1 Tax=Rhodocollybia butyracea TaxID=206335 RepID=A0A9P5PCP2_9AGAR|nr:hypothetical protein BDP27DRAFT_449038 [Rhodocollybia butyracea]